MAIVTFGKEKFFHLGMTPEEVKAALHGDKPSEVYYWINETVTTIERGGFNLAIPQNKNGCLAMIYCSPASVTVFVDGVKYANVPNVGGADTPPMYGEPLASPMTWETYPFLVTGEGIAFETSGEHTIAVVYDLPLVTLTLECTNSPGEGGGYLVASFDENNVYSAEYSSSEVDPDATYSTIYGGESVTLTVPVNGISSGTAYQVAYVGSIDSVSGFINAQLDGVVLSIVDIETPECNFAASWEMIS